MAKHRPSTAMLRPSSLIAAAALCLPLASASQPGAASPVPAPMRDLTWGQLNFLHTTDTHGWLGGHLLEPQYSADWGDYVSFAEHMRRKADERGADLLVIDTGDRVEGNGLYDSSSPKGLFTYDIFREQAVDILCTGNHELYQADAAQREHDITVPNFRENYIASNLDYIDPKTGDRVPQAQRYRKFKTKNQGLEIVALGFLFDFTGNANNTVVQPVEDTIKSDWFTKMLEEEKPDLFVVIGHVGLRMPEFKAIFTAIRKGNWFAPIAFFGGHAHVRDALKFDKDAFAIASGRYGETIGWVSIDNIKKAKSASAADEVSAEIAPSASFTRKYIDNNLFGLYHHTGLTETTFPTEHGKNVTKMIEKARKALDLDYKYGCAPKDLWVNRAPYPSDDSIFTWLETQVLPDVIHKKDRKDVPRLAIVNTGGLRFDIFKGAFTKDSTYIVSPFTSTFKYIPDVPYGVAKRVIELLNKAGKIFEATHDTRFMNIPEMLFPKDDMVVLKTEQEGEPRRLELRQETDQHPLSGDDGDSSKKPDLIGGYTTKDDIGADGDDTEHTPIQFYEVPNCVQAEIGFPKEGEPEKVDVVFIDFILQWVLVALKFSGGDYSEKDVLTWSDDTLTYKMSEWIKENWKGDC